MADKTEHNGTGPIEDLAEDAKDKPKRALTELEKEVAELLNDEDGLFLMDLNIEKADLSMPLEFRDNLWANQRMQYAGGAAVRQFLAAANKVLNPAKAQEALAEYNSYRWVVAAIDKKFPHIKALSDRIMEYQAIMERKEWDSKLGAYDYPQ